MSDKKELKEDKKELKVEPKKSSAPRFIRDDGRERVIRSIDHLGQGNLKFEVKDPADLEKYDYHWVLDGDPDQRNSFEDKFNLGYDPVSPDEVLHQSKSESPSVQGNCVAAPAKGGVDAKLVLCKIPKEIRARHLKQTNERELAKVKAADIGGRVSTAGVGSMGTSTFSMDSH